MRAARKSHKRARRSGRAFAFSGTGDPLSLGVLAERHLADLQIQGYSANTLFLKYRSLRTFLSWAQDRGLSDAADITRAIVERFQRHLFYTESAVTGRPLSLRSQQHALVALRMFFKWLSEKRYVLYNPAGEIRIPSPPRELPAAILSAREAEAVLSGPDLSQPRGLRDRALLELLYSTGIRRQELVNLDLYDLDTESGTIVIRAAKWGSDRVLPTGRRALRYLQKYLNEVRPQLLSAPDERALFLSNRGVRFYPNSISILVREYVKQADIGKPGSVHLFRHTMATLMLENGADIRFIQRMLGHRKLETTQLYTHVSVNQLRQVHALTHPAEKRETQDRPS
ncbi:MAG: site-specific tyrosine recombinase XerC [Spirochaetales bacterium]|nr:site-specific tyrosine recombinase XerC [Spirochaetales bacterium]